ncbi:MAG: hypothetical protein ABI378_00245 [Chitinophagaceae bacterium]
MRPNQFILLKYGLIYSPPSRLGTGLRIMLAGALPYLPERYR